MARQTVSTAEHLPPESTPSPVRLGPVGVRRWQGILTETPLRPEPHVRIQTPDGVEHRFEATRELAQNVFKLRGQEVVAMCTRGTEDPRVIWLHASDQVPAPPAPEEATAYFMKRWAKTLAILAE